MTAKQVYKNILIELSKVNAPAVKLYEFNYYFNKAITQYVNLIYGIYDTTQQTTDDLRVLQGSIYLKPTKIAKADNALVTEDSSSGSPTVSEAPLQSLYGATYECWLPLDYLHILNCVCFFEVAKSHKCHKEGTIVQYPATRLTSDMWPLAMDDIYNRPSPKKPYYQIYNHNRNIQNGLPSDPIESIEGAVDGEAKYRGTDINGTYGVTSFDSDTLADGSTKGSNAARTFTFRNGHKESLVERSAAQRIGNPTGVRLEIRYGRDDSLYKLREVQVDYLRTPQFIRLTQEQVDLTQDVSQILEWPDYVCYEIINILLRLLMERTGDPRLSSNIQINNSIVRSSVPSGGAQ